MSTEMIHIAKEHGALYGSINPSCRVSSIDSMSINFDSRRKGLGSELFNEFLAKAEKLSDIICIEIHNHNDKAIKFWESHGFKYLGLLDQDYLEYSKVLNKLQ